MLSKVVRSGLCRNKVESRFDKKKVAFVENELWHLLKTADLYPLNQIHAIRGGLWLIRSYLQWKGFKNFQNVFFYKRFFFFVFEYFTIKVLNFKLDLKTKFPLLAGATAHPFVKTKQLKITTRLKMDALKYIIIFISFNIVRSKNTVFFWFIISWSKISLTNNVYVICGVKKACYPVACCSRFSYYYFLVGWL